MSGPFALYSNAAVRELERRAKAADGFDEDALMRRAGEAAWRQLLQAWPQAQRILVVCGPGDNGGDGWVLAKHAQDSGRDVRVLRLADHAPRTPSAQRMAAEFRDAGGVVDIFDGGLPQADIAVDALFGIGCNRELMGDAAVLVQAINSSAIPVLALDVPSGVDAETGHVPGVAITANHTIQFIAAHAGLATGAALEHVGETSVSSLDMPCIYFDELVPAAEVLQPPYLLRRRRNSHKGQQGHLLAIGGDHGMGGAIVLAAEAALRSGAGLVSVATRAEHVPALLVRRPEAMAHAIDDAPALAALLDRVDAFVIGPGMGQGRWATELLHAALATNKPGVLDADALNLLANSPRTVLSAVLTPHPGEAARLLGIDTTAVQANRYGAANDLADKFQCAVVLKGAGSLVAAAGRITRVCPIGNPGMATGGMGDALAGIIGTLLAQGHDAFEAASVGTWLHARAGDRAALVGESGLLASDLIAELPVTRAEYTHDA